MTVPLWRRPGVVLFGLAGCVLWLMAIVFRSGSRMPWTTAVAPIGLLVAVTTTLLVVQHPFAPKDRLLKIALFCNPCGTLTMASLALLVWRSDPIAQLAWLFSATAIVLLLTSFAVLSSYMRHKTFGSQD